MSKFTEQLAVSEEYCAFMKIGDQFVSDVYSVVFGGGDLLGSSKNSTTTERNFSHEKLKWIIQETLAYVLKHYLTQLNHLTTKLVRQEQQKVDYKYSRNEDLDMVASQ